MMGEYHKVCMVCGELFKTYSKTQFCCSDECKRKWKYQNTKNRCHPSINNCLNCTKEDCTYTRCPTKEESKIIKDLNLDINLPTINMKVGV